MYIYLFKSEHYKTQRNMNFVAGAVPTSSTNTTVFTKCRRVIVMINILEQCLL